MRLSSLRLRLVLAACLGASLGLVTACGDDGDGASCAPDLPPDGDATGHPAPLGASPTEARAGRITDASQLPATTLGLETWAVGDFVLANDRVALVIEDAELSLSAGHMALENLSRQNVDGIFVMASSDKRFSGLFEAIERVGLPLVFVGGRGHRYGDCVDLDYASGLREAARHLAGLGHRRMGFVCGLPEGERFAARQRLYAGALRDAGLRFHASLFVECEPTCDGAARAAKALLGTGNGRRPTAIVAVNDLLAIGVVRAIREMGLRVPEDISVVGNDNLSVGEHQPVALTTLSAPLRELAEAAASCFLSRQKKGGAGRGEGSPAVKLPVALVARESTARAPTPNLARIAHKPRENAWHAGSAPSSLATSL